MIPPAVISFSNLIQPPQMDELVGLLYFDFSILKGMETLKC